MADYTVQGVIGIVAIVLVAAVFLQTANNTNPNANAENLVGEASTMPASTSANQCEPARYCSGSKLIIVRQDCSIAEAFCRRGCIEEETAICA